MVVREVIQEPRRVNFVETESQMGEDTSSVVPQLSMPPPQEEIVMEKGPAAVSK